MKKKRSNTLVRALIVIIIVVLAINIYLITINFSTIKEIEEKNQQVEKLVSPIEKVEELKITNDPLSLKEFTKVFVGIRGTNIMLENNCTILPILTNEYQAYSIEQGIKSRIDVRPTTHDIMVNVLNNFNVTLLQAKVVETKGPHFYARTVYKQGDKLLNIDTKASDAIALALRMNVPVYVKNDILFGQGQKVC